VTRRFAVALAAVEVAVGVFAAAPAQAVRPPSPFARTPAPDGGGEIGALWRTIAAAFDEASAAREPPPRPPVAVPVKWKARRVASLDLGAPLLALAAGDLDGDHKAELVALTERHVVVLRPAKKSLAEVARIALPSDPATIRPRDAVGTLVIARGEGGAAEIRARASTRGRGARWVLDGKTLREVGPLPAFPLCADLSGTLAPGRNYFASPPAVAAEAIAAGRRYAAADIADTAPYYTMRCRDDVVDRAGRAVRAQVTVETGGAGVVELEVRCGARDTACVARRQARVDGVGVAIEIDDVDRDGTLEIITSGAGAPGDADALVVWNLGDAGIGRKPVFRRGFSGGVVGHGSGDVDGDGDRDVFAAVRLAGARKVDVWLVN
jgi:hypothetical protein